MTLIKHIIKKVNDYNCKHNNHIYKHISTNVQPIKFNNKPYLEVNCQFQCINCKYKKFIITQANIAMKLNDYKIEII